AMRDSLPRGPDLIARLEQARIDADGFALHALTQRPMVMYHSWDSQNVWLRQLLAQNHLYMNAGTARQLGLADGDWVWIESWRGRVRCQLKTMEGVEANTVWTWNGVGKQGGAWGVAPDAAEATHGFLLNHLISEHLPKGELERRITNSDPVTGQAAWFDVRVRVYKATPGETGVWPTLPAAARLPGDDGSRPSVLRWEWRVREARPRHRPRHLRALPRVRRGLQGVERVLRDLRTALGLSAVWRRALGRLVQPHSTLRGRGVSRGEDAQRADVVHALRGRGLRHGLSHRRVVQAGRRHRARRPGQVHGVQLLRLGLSLRGARARRFDRDDEEVHALRRPDLRRAPAAGGPPTGLRARMPDACALLRRSRRSGVRGVATRSQPRRVCNAPGARLQAGEPVSSAAAAARDHGGRGP